MSGIDGSWDLTLHAPQGDQVVVLEVDAAGPSGTLSADNESGDLIDLVIDGDTATWSSRLTRPMPLTVEFNVTADGDQLVGQATAMSVIKIPLDGTRR